MLPSWKLALSMSGVIIMAVQRIILSENAGGRGQFASPLPGRRLKRSILNRSMCVCIYNIESACSRGLWLQNLVFKAVFLCVHVSFFTYFDTQSSNFFFLLTVLQLLSLSIHPGFLLAIQVPVVCIYQLQHIYICMASDNELQIRISVHT